MNYIAYFIGGPLDLTKMAVKQKEARLYALARTAYTLPEINKPIPVQAVDFREMRHVYRYKGECEVMLENPILVYMYDGLEQHGRKSKPDVDVYKDFVQPPGYTSDT